MFVHELSGCGFKSGCSHLHNDLPFLPERIKIEKVEKLVANSHDKTECIVPIRNLIRKQALYHGLVLKILDRVIKFKQNAWSKSYIDMNTDLRKKAKNDFGYDFFELMNNAIFEKTRWVEKACHNRKKKKLFGVRTKLSYYKVFYRKYIAIYSNKNEENADTYK